MTREELLQAIDELIELDPGTLAGTERLDELESWDSLAVIGYIALIDEKLGKVLDGDRLSQAQTVDDIVALAIEEA